MALPARIPAPPRAPAPLLLPGTLADTRTRSRTLARAHSLEHAGAHSRTLNAPATRPLFPLRAREWLPGSATEACRVGVAQTSLRGSRRPPGAYHRLPCSPRSMSVPPRSRRSARRAPPRRSALRPRPPRAVPTPGVGAALPGAGPGRHRPPDRDLCAPPRRRGRWRWAGAQKVGKGRGGAGKGRGRPGCVQAAASRAGGVCTSPASLRRRKFPPRLRASRLPLSPPLCTCWSGKHCLQGGTSHLGDLN